MPVSRNCTSYVTEWIDPLTGEIHQLNIRHARDYMVQGQDHIEIQSAKGQRRHPLSETGYRSHFIAAPELANASGPVAFVDAWLKRALACKDWRQAETKRSQGDLFQWADAREQVAAKRRPTNPRKPKTAVKATHSARKRAPS